MKKFLSAFLSVVMLLSLSVSAFAADYNDAYVQVDLDGSNIYATSRMQSGFTDILATNARELESLEVNDASISLNSISATAASAETRYANGYDVTAGTYKIYSEILNGVRVIRLSWNNLRTGLFVTAESTSHGSFEISCNAKPVNACNISNAGATVEANGSFETVFTPVNASQEIKSLTFSVNGTVRDVAVPASGRTSAVIANQDVDILVSGNSVTVSVDQVVSDMTITAQVYNYGSRHLVTVTPDDNIKTSVSSDYVNDNTREVIKLTPSSGVNVGDITIISDNHTYTVDVREESARVNNMYFEFSRDAYGVVTIVIDRVTADVEIRAYANTDTARIEVVADKSLVNCEKTGVQYVSMDEPFVVRFDARRDTILSKIKITTDAGVYTAGTDEDYIRVNGQYYNIWRNIDGDVTLSINRVPGNMKIELLARDTVHDVRVRTDSRIEADVSRTEVDDGDSLNIKFTPKDSNNEIRLIRVTVGDEDYSADPRNAKYVTVDGDRWYFKFESNNVIILECEDIDADIEVYASTVRGGSGSGSSDSSKTYRITKSPDSRSNISFDGSNPFDSGDDVNIRVYTDSNYVLKNVRLTVNGKSSTITPFDKTVKVDGETYDITWKSNMDMTIKLEGIYANITVSATSVKGTEKYPDGSNSGNNNGNNNNNGNFEIIVKPTPPDTGSSVNPGVGAYHMAYMYGYGDNTFRPDNAMTRAQAVAILARLYSGISEESFKAYAGTPGFQDVNPNSTFSGYIGYAKQSGYLAGIVGSGLNFYPNKAITRAEFCYLLCSFMNANLVGVSTTQKFNDVASNHWAVVYVNYCSERGWANGYADGMFKPDSSLTRAQICAIVNRINNRAVATTMVGFNLRNFNDVSSSYWAYSDIMEATHNHTVSSVSDGKEVWAKSV